MATDAQPPVEPGQVLAGKYRVERVLGQGGMGVVVAAEHVTLKEKVALKFLLPHVLGKAETVERFLREAQASVRVKSEHVARVSDVGTLESGAPYMVMEFLEGRDLSEILDASGALPIQAAVGRVLQACEAVAEAHSLGIVHRDLKPANLFLTSRRDGSSLIKVLDFGISKVTTAESKDLTSTQGTMGSPQYMSPEQVRSAKNVDARADIWSLGVILHELVAGQPPFDADTVSGVLAAIAADPPVPLRKALPGAPAGLEAVILRCLEKDPAGRYPSVGALAEALLPFAPPGAHLSVERASRLAGDRSPSLPDGTLASMRDPLPVASVREVAPEAETVGAWNTQGETKKPGSKLPLIVGGLGVALVGAAAVAFLLRGPSDPKPSASAAAEPPPPPASAPAATSSSPSVAPVVDVPPTTSASAAPSAEKGARPKPGAPKPGGAPPAVAPPKPNTGNDSRTW